MYRVAICDDEPLFTSHLKKITREVLIELGIDYDISEFASGSEFLKAVRGNPGKYHLLLLDILLGDRNGVEVAKALRNAGITASILFITNAREYALEGYAVQPIHYLLKPIQKQQLLQIIDREYRERFLVRHILLPVKGGERAVELNSILYIEAISRQIVVHTAGVAVDCPGALKDFLQRVPDELFVQCHKSYIVNLSKVAQTSRRAFSLKNGEEIPIGRVYHQQATDKFITYLNRR